jgi:hypothetical protein
MKTAIITTTIHVPKLLADYAADAVKHGRSTEFFVVADRKTPPEAENFCRKVAEDYGVPVRWLGVGEQEDIMAPFPELAKHIPWNCIQRRNVGHLLAYMEGFEVLVAIDDDNFRVDDDYAGLHIAALSAEEMESVSAPSGWFNCCEMLEEAQGRYFFPRGYPMKPRVSEKNELSYGLVSSRIVVNAGLWLGDPDVDAVTRLALAPNVAWTKHGNSVALGAGTWCPFNSQNTAVHRDVLPAWMMSPDIGRYDDIWGSYVALTCMEKMGHALAFGRPLVRQDRNAHDLLRDLDLERLGMRFTDGLCAALREAPLSGKDYATCTEQALKAISGWIARDPSVEKDRATLEKFVEGYSLWVAAFRKIAVQQPALLAAV